MTIYIYIYTCSSKALFKKIIGKISKLVLLNSREAGNLLRYHCNSDPCNTDVSFEERATYCN